jgi:hypothetical protein
MPVNSERIIIVAPCRSAAHALLTLLTPLVILCLGCSCSSTGFNVHIHTPPRDSNQHAAHQGPRKTEINLIIFSPPIPSLPSLCLSKRRVQSDSNQTSPYQAADCRTSTKDDLLNSPAGEPTSSIGFPSSAGMSCAYLRGTAPQTRDPPEAEPLPLPRHIGPRRSAGRCHRRGRLALEPRLGGRGPWNRPDRCTSARCVQERSAAIVDAGPSVDLAP